MNAENPSENPTGNTPGPVFAEKDAETVKKIQEILERDVRPALARDGGDAALCSYHDGVVQLYLRGACHGCPGASMTLKWFIEGRLKEAIPEIVEVQAV